MGCMSGKEPRKESRREDDKKRGKIEIHCPICQENYDIDDRKPYVVCANKHKLCFACLSSMKNHASLKRAPLLCPFCKAAIEEDMLATDSGIYNFLDAELDTLKRLPQQKHKLFAFSSIYLPRLHEFMKTEAKGDGNKLDKKSGKKQAKGTSIDSIELLRIKGRMLEEYEVFELEMLECMVSLRKIYLSNNHIKAIDTAGFTLNKITLLDLGFNRIVSLKNIFSEGPIFSGLKVLIARDNIIEELPGVKNLQNLQVINIKNNKLKTLRWLVGCTALRHLDVQFNQISQRVQFPVNFAQLHSLLMFGNNIALQSWESFTRLTWRDLSLLTASVDASLLEKYNIHNRIAKLPAPCLKLLIFQVGEKQPQNTDDLEHSVGSIGQNLLARTRKVEITASSYLFYSENKSFLRQIIDLVVRSRPLGININFKPAQIDHKVYSEDERLSTYKKVNSSQDPSEYLYSLPLGGAERGKVFMSFKAKTHKLLVGVRQKSQSQNRIEVSLQREIVAMNKQEHKTKPFKSGLNNGEEFTVSMGIDIGDGYVSFVVGSTILDNYYFTERWEDYRFYVHVVEQGESIKIVRDQLQII